jgi:hypothetical protein
MDEQLNACPEISESLTPSEESVAADVVDATDSVETIDTAVVEEKSAEYLGQWNHLVSTTNWEKGHIIAEWRKTLLEAGAPITECSDEAWSRRVGNVTPQHVGRLRRVHEQFGHAYDRYEGLYWSHFQAALDWHDAEMWLEGAMHNDWSVAQMRKQRWQATGAVAEAAPRDEEIVSEEVDTDAPVDDGIPDAIGQTMDEVHDPDACDMSDDSADDEDSADDDENDAPFDENPEAVEVPSASEPVRPFENLVVLPPDLNEPFEAIKLAILRHKVGGWTDIPCGDILAALDALKQLALAPAE